MNHLSLYSVTRPNNTVIVAIMFNRQNKKYHFVNLSHNHICPCAFDTKDDAVKDMDHKVKTGEILYYHKL